MLSTEPFEVPKYLETLASKLPGLAVAIAGADHPIALESARRVAETGTIEPVLIGDADTIHNLAKDAGWDLSDIRILHEPDEEKKAGIAAALAKGREVAIIMKGHVHTDALMRAVLRRDAGLDDDPSLINDLYRACADVGFFYVRNHGVSMELVESVKRAAEDFFTAPMAEKMKVVLDQRIRGFYAHNRVTSVGHLIEGEDRSGLNCKEGFWAGHERPLCDSALLHGPNQWPEDHPELKQSMLTFFDAAEGLAEVLLRGLARSLGLEEQRFDCLFEKPMTSLLINYYPPQENPTTERNIGLSPHFDAGGITILWQDDCGGLEIQNKSGEWVEAPPIDGTFVINIGNVMQLWTNRKFSSTPHRVVNRGKRDRYSIPLFVNPSYDVDVRPLVDIDRDHPAEFTYGPYQRDVWRQTFPITEIPN